MTRFRFSEPVIWHLLRGPGATSWSMVKAFLLAAQFIRDAATQSASGRGAKGGTPTVPRGPAERQSGWDLPIGPSAGALPRLENGGPKTAESKSLKTSSVYALVLRRR